MVEYVPSMASVGLHIEGLTPALVVDVPPDDGVPVAPVSEPVDPGLHIVWHLPQHRHLTLPEDDVSPLPN